MTMPEPKNRPPALDGVLETALYAEDLDAAHHFYHEMLGLDVIARETGRHNFYRCGNSVFLIFNPRATAVTNGHRDIPVHGAHGPGHAAFSVAPEALKAWKQRLASFDVSVEREIDWPNGAKSIYFRDPANNSLELATPSLWSDFPAY